MFLLHSFGPVECGGRGVMNPVFIAARSCSDQ